MQPPSTTAADASAATLPTPPGRMRRFLGHPVTRLVLFCAALIGVQVLPYLLVQAAVALSPAFKAWLAGFPRYLGLNAPLPAYAIVTALMVAAIFPVYRLLTRWLEQRVPDEISARGAVRETVIGIALGVGLLTAVVLILFLIGCYSVLGYANDLTVLMVPLLIAANAAVFEELLFRAVLFRIVEQSLGSAIALLVSALFFGGVHLMNPNSSLFAAIAIAIEAGLLLGAVYMLTRRVWAVIGLHFAWNFTQGGIYGIPVSGIAMPGLLEHAMRGPEFVTGGSFGIEASLVTVLACSGVATGILVAARQRGRWIAPFWRRGS